VTLSDAAAADAAAHLARLDALAPGQVSAVHVIGSAVLDDYHPGTSDLDLVIELAHDPSEADLRVLLDAHVGVGAKVEGTYVASGKLGDPAPIASLISDGVVHFASKKLHAVTRLQLANYAATIRGAAPAIEADVPAAQDFCRRNLVEYWQDWLTGGPRIMLRYAPAPLTPGWLWTVAWVGLGPARLWRTINTGEIVSKSRAGELAAEHWPDLGEQLLDIVAERAGRGRKLGNKHGRAAVEVGRRIMAEVGVGPAAFEARQDAERKQDGDTGASEAAGASE
jgi:streptomycin 3"-adenylyltransferase